MPKIIASVNFDQDIHDTLRKHAVIEGRSLSNLVNHLLRNAMEDEGITVERKEVNTIEV